MSLAQPLPVKLLWVKAGKLLPVDTGGKIRSFNILRHLSARNEVTLLSYYGGRRDTSYERALAGVFPPAIALHTGAPGDSLPSAAADYARRLFWRAPYAVAKFTAPAVRRMIADWDAEGRFDVAVCDFLSASLNFPLPARTPLVLFQHNVESVLWGRQADTERHLLKRIVFAIEAAKMRRYEHATVGRFDHVIAVSERDREAMRGMAPLDRISVVHTGVDAQAFRPAVRRDPAEPIVLFLGSMDWEPNIDGVQYFCERVWPAVRAAVPDAQFHVVGRNPSPAVRRLAGDGITVVGTVPSVVEHLARAAVVVVPLRAGGGTRLKIYEAMAAGRAVVSTTVGAEGLDVHDGEDIVLADDPSRFAAAVVRLLGEPVERRRLEDAALALASRYDWAEIAREFELSLGCAADRAGAPADRAVA